MAQLYRNLVDSAVNRTINQDQLRGCCKALGASDTTVEEVLSEVEQRLHVRFEKSKETGREGGGESDGDDEHAEARPEAREHVEGEVRRRADEEQSEADEDAGELSPGGLRRKLHDAKLSGLRSLAQEGVQDLVPFLELLEEERPINIPASVLAAAPHLASLNSIVTDPHIQKTAKIRQSFVSDKFVNPVIDRLLLKYRRDPPSRAIWKDIILDKYVNFEKLYAALEPSFDHNDEIKDFGGGLGLVKTDQYNAKKKVGTESEWTRVYHSWAGAVKEVYAHRSDELDRYELLIREIFESERGDPGIAIRTDIIMRQKYAHQPYHLDAREYMHLPLFAEVMASVRTRQKPPLAKRLADSSPAGPSIPFKRSAAACENWSFGQCSDPCPNGRKHGLCCECLEAHRAQDSPECLASLRRKRGSRNAYHRRISSQGGGGA